MAEQAEPDYGCYPWDQIKAANDRIKDGPYPEEPSETTTKKLMSPQTEEPE